MGERDSELPRIALFSRYSLAEQFDLAAEFREMVHCLAESGDVYHLSLKGPRDHGELPERIQVDLLPASVNRASSKDVLIKTMSLYFLLPIAIWKFRKFRPDVIFLTEIIPLAGWILRWSCQTRVGTAYGDRHLHNFFAGKWWSGPVLKTAEWLEKFEIPRLQGLFCRAESARIRLNEWGVEDDRIRVVHDAPDPSAFYPRDEGTLRKKIGFKNEDVVLLYHGVMHHGKGLDMLLNWTAELLAGDPRIAIVMVGGGPEEASLRQQAQDLGLGSRVHFTGWLPTIEDVGRYCNAADICIAMRTGAEANDKIVPGALLHSMACGKVVIGPALRGISEIIRDGVNGFTFRPDDGGDFQTLIRRLADERDSWSRVGETAYQDICRTYSVTAAARQYAQAIAHFGSVDRPCETTATSDQA